MKDLFILCVTRSLSSLLSTFAQAYSCFEFIVINSIIPQDKEIIFFVTFRRLTFDIPIVFASHLIFVFFVVFIQNFIREIFSTFFHCVVHWKEVSHELFTTFVHDTTEKDNRVKEVSVRNEQSKVFVLFVFH